MFFLRGKYIHTNKINFFLYSKSQWTWRVQEVQGPPLRSNVYPCDALQLPKSPSALPTCQSLRPLPAVPCEFFWGINIYSYNNYLKRTVWPVRCLWEEYSFRPEIQQVCISLDFVFGIFGTLEIRIPG